VKVLLAGPLPPPRNGMTVMTETLLDAVGREGDAVILHSDMSDHRPVDRIGRLDFRNVVLAFIHAWRFLGMLLRSRPEVVHLMIARSRRGFARDALMLLPARLSRAAVVIHFHSRDFMEFYRAERPWFRALIRACLGEDAHAVVLGESRRSDFAGLISPERTHVVPNGVPDLGMGPSAEDRSAIAVHIAGLGRQKGTHDAIQACIAARNAGCDVHLKLAGEWRTARDRETAEALIAGANAHRFCTYLGPVSGDVKAELIRSAAVMLLPTRYAYESHPLVILEAFAAGTPVIASAIGAIPEMIEHDVNGYLVDPDDHAALSDRIRAVMDDSELRSRLSAQARQHYEDRFTASRLLADLEQVWREASLGRSGPPSSPRVLHPSSRAGRTR
jgi:glycosyltransferase involved in cell wall biosynthesis